MANVITVYFSGTEDARPGEERTGAWKEAGATKTVAGYIQEAVGGDLFAVRTVNGYPANPEECARTAREELRSHARPELREYPEHLEEYDMIFVGYPNWWGTMPMPMYSLLEHFRFKGQHVAPFCTNGGDGMGDSERALRLLCRGAHVEEGLSVTEDEVEEKKEQIQAWARKHAACEA